tara:strand:- start:11 stop:778 length:768 start_codon:yes stop_codon:yes gene_type:complete
MKQTRLLLFREVVNIDEDVAKFKNREVKAKEVFTIKEVSKLAANNFVAKYHYLKDAVHPFPKFWVGLFISDELVGVAIYGLPQGISAVKSWFGVKNSNTDIIELTRLCMLPDLNGSNATSYLLGNSIKLLKNKGVRAITSLADSVKHVGSIYQVCNFKYYGLTDKKTDFFCADGRLNPRGKTKDLKGVWLPRARKHRYCYLLDKDLKVLLTEESKPKISNTFTTDCCNETHKVFDKRFNKHYTCPKCIGVIEELI